MENIRHTTKNTDKKPDTIAEIKAKRVEISKEIEDIEAKLAENRRPLGEVESKIVEARAEEEAKAKKKLKYRSLNRLKHVGSGVGLWLKRLGGYRGGGWCDDIELPVDKIEKKIDKMYGKEVVLEREEYKNLTKELKDRLKTLRNDLKVSLTSQVEEEARQEEEAQKTAKRIKAEAMDRQLVVEEKAEKRQKEDIKKQKLAKFKATLKYRDTHAISLINLAKAKHKKTNIYQMALLAEKKISQILKQICEIHKLALVETKQLPPYQQRKYKKFRLTKYHRGFYLIPLRKKVFKKS